MLQRQLFNQFLLGGRHIYRRGETFNTTERMCLTFLLYYNNDYKEALLDFSLASFTVRLGNTESVTDTADSALTQKQHTGSCYRVCDQCKSEDRCCVLFLLSVYFVEYILL